MHTVPAYGNETICSCLLPHLVVGRAWPGDGPKQQREVAMNDEVTNSRHVPHQPIEDRAQETLQGLTLGHLARVGGAWCGREGVEGGGGTRAFSHHREGVRTGTG